MVENSGLKYLISKKDNRLLLCSIIFIFALAVRLLFVFTYLENYVTNDGVGYHNLAVNLVKGNGYTADITPPFEPNFFREPGYPIFLASIYKIYDCFGDLNYLHTNEFQISNYSEIRWARAAQAILGAATCVLFYLTMRLFLAPAISFTIACLFSLYVPLIVYTSILLRETFQAFLVMSLSYCFASFLLEKKFHWLLLSCIVWAALNMTLQIHIWIFPVLFLFCIIWFKNISKSFGIALLSFFVMTIIISPWLLRTYRFYPDVRVFKSLGTSLTYELVGYTSDMNLLRKVGAQEESALLKEFRPWKLSDKERFALSFSGHFDSKKKSLDLSGVSFCDKAKIYLRNFRNAWMKNLWYKIGSERPFINTYPKRTYLAEKKYALFLLSLFAFGFGYISVLGILLFYKRLFPMMLPFSFYLPLFPFIGSESRRGLPAHSFIFLFSCLAVYYLYQRFIRNVSHNNIYLTMFKAD